jgi:hypothetical protein
MKNVLGRQVFYTAFNQFSLNHLDWLEERVTKAQYMALI